MDRIKFLPVLCVIFLAACGKVPSGYSYQPPTNTVPQTVTPLPPGIDQQQVDAYVAQAQIANATAESARMAATHQSLLATQQIEDVTRSAVYAETATAVTMNNFATQTAVSVSQRATETAVAVFAANESNNQMATAISIQATGTAMSIYSQQQATIAVASANGTAQAISDASDYQKSMADVSARQMEQEMEAARQKQFRANIITFAFVAIVMVGVVVVGYQYINRGRVQVHQAGDRVSYFVHTPVGLRPALPSLPRNDVLALPSPRSNVIISEGEIEGNASWTRFSDWNDLRYLPIGASPNGPIMIDTNREPHAMIAGYTGTGKTRRILWPTVSAALASGVHVMLVNERGSDFKPFRNHPNVTIVRGNRNDMPKLAAMVLSSAVKEVDRRDKILAEHGVSTWNRLPSGIDDGAEVVIVIDEFLALARSRMIDPDMQKLMMESAIVLTSEARKFGIRLLITVTSPGRRALGDEGLTIRDQCARISLALKDKATSHAFMGDSSAMGLPEGHFIANVSGRVHKGVAFCPTERDIEGYLLGHRVEKADLPQNIAAFNAQEHEEYVFDANDPLNHPKADEIIQYWLETNRRSKRLVERSVFNYTGGEAYQIVTAVINAYEAENASTEGVYA